MSEENKVEPVVEPAVGDSDDVLKAKVDEFRANNIALQKRLDEMEKTYKGIDVEKYSALQELERQKRDKELIDSKQFDVLIEERTKNLQHDWEGKYNKIAEEKTQAEARALSIQKRYDIETAAIHSIAEMKINPELTDAVLALVKAKFDIDNGQVVAIKDGQIEAGKDGGNLTIKGFIESLPESFKIKSVGSGARGSEGVRLATDTAVSGHALISEGLAEMFKK